ncbi:MAG: AAA family ATPase, partial [Gemmataceae bacterium]
MIERIYVNNYRCFENFTLDLTDRPSALIIGKNGAGKSTLLRALQVFHWIGSGANPVKRLITRGDFAQGRTDVPMRFEADLNLGGK